nr:helix-turn-helix domain-containing protein [Burkholderia mayonis]
MSTSDTSKKSAEDWDKADIKHALEKKAGTFVGLPKNADTATPAHFAKLLTVPTRRQSGSLQMRSV